MCRLDISLDGGDDRPPHQNLPLVREAIGVANACAARETAQERPDVRDRRRARRADRARPIALLEQALDEEAALVVVAPEPLVEDIEDRKQALPARAPAMLDLLLEPSAAPDLFATLESREHELLLRGEVPVERHLRDPGFGDDPVDSHRLNAVTGEEIVRGAENPLPRGAHGPGRPHAIGRVTRVDRSVYFMKGNPIAVELRHFRYLVAVVDELHFGRAAARLHMTQPPLSQAIRQLEDQLGVELLHRTSRAVTPTEAGFAFAEHAREVLTRADVAVREARQAGGAETVIRIGSSPYLPIEHVRRFLDALRRRDPSSQARVTELLPIPQLHRLLAGELDLGVFAFPEEVDGIESESLFEGEPLAAFLPSGNRLAAKTSLGPDDVRDEVLVAMPRELDPEIYRAYIGFLEHWDYRFAKVLEAGGASPRELMLTVAGGAGITIQRSSFDSVAGASEGVIMRPLDPPVWTPDTVVAWRSRATKRLETVIAAAREAARELRRLPPHAGLPANA